MLLEEIATGSARKARTSRDEHEQQHQNEHRRDDGGAPVAGHAQRRPPGRGGRRCGRGSRHGLDQRAVAEQRRRRPSVTAMVGSFLALAQKMPPPA